MRTEREKTLLELESRYSAAPITALNRRRILAKGRPSAEGAWWAGAGTSKTGDSSQTTFDAPSTSTPAVTISAVTAKGEGSSSHRSQPSADATVTVVEAQQLPAPPAAVLAPEQPASPTSPRNMVDPAHYARLAPPANKVIWVKRA